jgi:THO complex subunit 3
LSQWEEKFVSLSLYLQSPKKFLVKYALRANLITFNLPRDIHQERDLTFLTVFVTTGEGRVKVLSYPDFEPIFHLSYDPGTPFTLNGHTSSCLSVEIQPTARHIATGGSDSIIALWDTTDWICQRTLTEMVGPVRSISFSFDGSYIVGGSDEGVGLEIAHVETGDYVHTVKTNGTCPVVAWHPSKYFLAYTDVGSLKIIGVDPERR